MSDAADLQNIVNLILANTQFRKMSFTYKNWRGVTERRVVVPKEVRYGATEWHPEPCYLLHAMDTKRKAFRDFKISDIVPGTIEVGDLEP